MLFLGSLALQASDPEATETRTARTYDIGFLIRPPSHIAPRLWPYAGRLLLAGEEEDSGLAAPISFAEAEAPASGGVAFEEEGESPPGVELTPEALVSLIRTNIAEDSWANENNRIEVRGVRLFVLQTPEVHAEISRLLDRLRRRRSRLVAVEAWVLPLGLLQGRAAGALLEDGELRALLEEAGPRALHMELTGFNGQRLSGFSGKQVTRFAETEINQTGVVPVVNPVLRRLPLGTSFDVLPRIVGGYDWIRLDLRIARMEEAGAAQSRDTPFGTLEFAPLAEESMETVLLVPNGEAVLAGVLYTRNGGPDRKEAGIVVRARSASAPEDADRAGASRETFERRLYDVDFLNSPLSRREVPLYAGDLLARAIRYNVDPDAWRDERTSIETAAGGRLLAVTARPETHARVRDYLRGLIAQRARSAVFELRQYAGPIRDLRNWSDRLENEKRGTGARDLEPPPGTELVHAATGTCLLGGSFRIRALTARPFLGGVEVVSGGTGFAVRALPGTAVETAGSGFSLLLRPAAWDGNGGIAVDLDFDEARTQIDRNARVLTAAELAPKAGGGGVRKVVTAPFDIDLPAQKRGVERIRRVLTPGRWIPLALRVAGDDAARLLVLRLEARELIAAPPPRPPEEARRLLLIENLESALKLPVLVSPTTGESWAPFLRRTLSSYGYENVAYDIDGESEKLARSRFLGFEDVLELVRSLVAPDTWANTRNALELVSTRALIVQRREVLAGVKGFIDHLRARAARRLLAEVIFVPPPVLRRIGAEALRPSGSIWLDGSLIERALAEAPGEVEVLQAECPPGQPVLLEPAELRRELSDYDVNQTGTIPVKVPSVRTSAWGTYARLTCLPSPSGRWARVDVECGRRLLWGSGERLRIPSFGDLDLQGEKRAGISVSAITPLGRAALLGALEVTGGGEKDTLESLAVLVRIREVATPARRLGDSETGGSLPRGVETDLLLAPLPRHRMFPREDDPLEWDGESPDSSSESILPYLPRSEESRFDAPPPAAWFEPDLLERTVEETLRAEGVPDPFLVRGGAVYVSSRGARIVEDALERRAKEQAVAISLSLWQGAVPEGAALARAGAVLGSEWVQRIAELPGTRMRLAFLSGSEAALGSAALRSYVADVELISGGREKEAIAVAADPIVAQVGSGILLEARAARVPGTSLVELHVRGETARRPRLDRRRKVRLDLEAQVEKTPEGREELRLAGPTLEVTLPDEDSDTWEHTVTVPAGSPVLLTVSPRTESGEGSRAVIAVPSLEPIAEGLKARREF